MNTSPTSRISSQMRFQQIDVVRGFAALSVAITHTAGHLTETLIAKAVVLFSVLFSHTFWANGGLHPGVIVFIVLSGFCIHLPVARDGKLASTQGFWSVYWKRRSIRIFPVFLLGCALGALAVFPYGIQDFADAGRVVAFNAFSPMGHIAGNEILQTVAVEIWLYVFYPITLFLYRKYGAAVLVSIALLIHLFPALLLVKGVDPTWVGSSLYAFYLYWIIGMLSAEAVCNSQKSIPMWVIASAFLLYVVLGNLVQIKGGHYAKSLFLAVWAGALLFALCRRHYQPRKFLVQLGKMSYTLYAVHLPLITLWAFFVGFSTSLSQIAFVAFLSAATVVFFLLVESPSHRIAQTFRPGAAKAAVSATDLL